MERATSGSSSPSPYAVVMPGVTVRNTFLEFDNCPFNNFQEHGFVRQSSEPAKPFHRMVSEEVMTGSEASFENKPGGWHLQVSEQSTTGSDNTVGDTQSEENFWGRTGDAHGYMVSRASGNRPFAQANSRGQSKSQCSEQMAVVAPAPQVQQSPSNQLFRFCPNCGAEMEPWHRFCPYCCFQLPPNSAFQQPSSCQIQGSQQLHVMQQGPQHSSAAEAFDMPGRIGHFAPQRAEHEHSGWVNAAPGSGCARAPAHTRVSEMMDMPGRNQQLNMMQQSSACNRVPVRTSASQVDMPGCIGSYRQQGSQHLKLMQQGVSETVDLLGSLRRFRYIESLPSDIERAHRLCEMLMRDMKVA